MGIDSHQWKLAQLNISLWVGAPPGPVVGACSPVPSSLLPLFGEVRPREAIADVVAGVGDDRPRTRCPGLGGEWMVEAMFVISLLLLLLPKVTS